MRAAWWQQVEAALSRGERVFVCLVVASTKGSPGSPGALLALAESGEPFGTIGGGGMERALLETAQDALRAPRYAPNWEVLHHHKGAVGKPSGLICGGSQTHLQWRFDPERDRDLVRAALAAAAAETGTIWRVTPGGCFLDPAPAATEAAAPAAEGLAGTATDWVFRHVLVRRRRVAIFGGGHCGVALAEVLRPLDCAVTVFERRAEVHTWRRLPAEERVVVPTFDAAAALVRRPAETYAIVMTSDFPSDVAALRGILPLPFPFVGVMGAKPKWQKIQTELAAAGFSAQDLARIHSPLGLPLGSDTPEEIAISVAAQILLKWNSLPPIF